MKAPDEIQDLCQAFVSGLNRALGEKLVGVYLYGALAFPEGGAIRDIDYHVILREPLSEGEESELHDLHAVLARDFALGAEMDGYYILLEEARQTSPPRHQLLAGVIDSCWALNREHIRAGRCIILQGPDPRELYPPASWRELEEALVGELQYVADHLGDYPDFCILNLCRLMYSFESQDVVTSKMAAAAWAWEALPQWRRLIELAKKSYARGVTAEERHFMMTDVRRLYQFACERIRRNPDH
jgi:hypothetical protein